MGLGFGCELLNNQYQLQSPSSILSYGEAAISFRLFQQAGKQARSARIGSGGGGIGGGSRGSGSGGGSGGSGSGGSGGSGRGSGTLMEPIYGSVHSGGVGVGLGKTCCRPQQTRLIRRILAIFSRRQHSRAFFAQI